MVYKEKYELSEGDTSSPKQIKNLIAKLVVNIAMLSSVPEDF